jgi:hypothetical protein
LAALSYGGAVGIAECEPDTYAATCLVGDDGQHAGIFGEEQRAVGQDAYLMLCRLEEALPDVARNDPAVRVHRSEFIGARTARERAACIGPKVDFVGTHEVR